MNVYVLLRNEPESVRRVFLGVHASRDAAVKAMCDDIELLEHAYSQGDYDILGSSLDTPKPYVLLLTNSDGSPDITLVHPNRPDAESRSLFVSFLREKVGKSPTEVGKWMAATPKHEINAAFANWLVERKGFVEASHETARFGY